MSTNIGIDDKTHGLSTAVVKNTEGFHIEAAFRRGQFEIKPVAKVVEGLFEDMEPVTVDIDQSLYLAKVFKTCASVDGMEALWVHSVFAKILALATAMPPPVSVTMKSCLLKNNANDSKIKCKLPDAHEHEPTAFVWTLATELMKVRAGKPSEVLAKNHWCLFYVAGLVVDIDWHSDDRKWNVDVWELGSNVWFAGNVVFSPN